MTDASDNPLAQSLELVARLVDGAGIGPTVAAVERRLEGDTKEQLLAEPRRRRENRKPLARRGSVRKAGLVTTKRVAQFKFQRWKGERRGAAA